MTDENTGRYCKCCRWFYRMEDRVGKCTEAHWCSIDYIRDKCNCCKEDKK